MKLSILEYMKYLDGSEHSKCVVEGENVLNAGHLILAGKIQETSCSEYVDVYGLCLQSSALDSPPHEITGKLALDKSITIVSMLCSCKAGNSGKCKHVSAFLIRCIRCIEVQKKAEDVETLSCISQTEKKCVWATQKNLTKEKYRPVPVSEMPCFGNKIKQSNIAVNSNEVLNFFCNKLPSSAVAKHRKGRREESYASTSSNIEEDINCETNFFTEILITSCQSPIMMNLTSVEVPLERDCCAQIMTDLCNEDVELAINIPQHSADWVKMRKYRITGSRCYEIYTYSKDDWKTKSIKYFNPIKVNNKYTKHGLKYECRARDIFVKISQMNVVECGLVIPWSNKWLGYSPDGVIFSGNRPLYLLEIKCTFEGKTKTIVDVIKNVKYIFEENGQYKLRRNHKYYGQIQMGMAVLNLLKTYFVLYSSFDDSLLIVDVDFDYDFTLNMLTRIKHNYFEKMIHCCCDK